MPLNVFLSIFWKAGVRERNVKLALETVTYIAATEIVTWIVTIEIIMYMMHCRKYHLHNGNRDCIISIKIVTHIFAAKTFICRDAAETSNCIIATERSTNITLAESTTNIIAIELQNLHNCNRRWHLHNCYRKRNCIVPTETATWRTEHRNFHSQKWCQSF